jgi:hypothetical protein
VSGLGSEIVLIPGCGWISVHDMFDTPIYITFMIAIIYDENLQSILGNVKHEVGKKQLGNPYH